MQTTLSRNDYENFLIQVYFGDRCFEQPLLACVDRAYLDFNRTLHGLRNVPRAQELRRHVRDSLATAISAICNPSDEMTQAAFDDWHRRSCGSIIDAFQALSFEFHAGQAQKWINMTLKYVFVFGETRIPGFSGAYPFCHSPIDRIVIERLTPLRFPKLSRAWSRLDYDEYIACQEWIRNKFLYAAS
jgi:hypothetical protein